VIDVAARPRYSAIVEDLDPGDAGKGFRQRMLATCAPRPCPGRLRLVGDRQDQAPDPFPEAILDPTLTARLATLVFSLGGTAGDAGVDGRVGGEATICRTLDAPNRPGRPVVQGLDTLDERGPTDDA